MSSVNIVLRRKQDIAAETTAFWFEKPEQFTFKAGQFCEFTHLDPPETDSEGNSRCFTLANAPFEEDLMIATRMRDSAFKRVLGQLEPGDALAMEGPFGSFTLHNNAAIRAVFLTGGIGATPLRSIVLQATRDELPHKIVAFVSNHTPDDAVFLEGLRGAREVNANLKLVPTITRMDKSAEGWDGETGRVTGELLGAFLRDFAESIYYIAGPPGMVAGLRQTLNQAGVDDDNIRAEDFTGY